ncbi:hypothetical protein A1O3_09527 [Capronia epimyces CBS 606.96]|uniref:Uncharacterized protein n=1 Tax=Capronia epimyces CBS 606.96 TaxID=1182542 RepID=W9XN48_9EURO|nr:uncharacterized protein A1O3_09527 [Capronia epimyces CBS 606.96]EXJ78366.1 hypothetical protein A1O3_09527 [Capronia epimyces CBS 606.96]
MLSAGETRFEDTHRVARWLSTLPEDPSVQTDTVVGGPRPQISHLRQQRLALRQDEYQDQSARKIRRKSLPVNEALPPPTSQSDAVRQYERPKQKKEKHHERTDAESDNTYHHKKTRYNRQQPPAPLYEESSSILRDQSTRRRDREHGPHINVDDPSEKYARRPRHKTRPDAYEFKGSRQNVACKRHSERQAPKRSGLLLNQKFQAPNVDTERLTLRHHPGPGLFAKGRRSAPLYRRQGVPDLTFPNMAFLERKRHGDAVQSRSQKEEHIRRTSRNANNDDISEFFSQPIDYKIDRRLPGLQHLPHGTTISSSTAPYLSDRYFREAHSHRWKPDGRSSTLEHLPPLPYRNTATTDMTSNGTYASWSISPQRQLAQTSGQEQGQVALSNTPKIATPIGMYLPQLQTPQAVNTSSPTGNRFLQDLTTHALLQGVEAFAYRGRKSYSLDDLKKMAQRRGPSEIPGTSDTHSIVHCKRSSPMLAVPAMERIPTPDKGVSPPLYTAIPSPAPGQLDAGTPKQDEAEIRFRLRPPIDMNGPSEESVLQHNRDAERKDTTNLKSSHHDVTRIYTLADFGPVSEGIPERPLLHPEDSSRIPESTQSFHHDSGQGNTDGRSSRPGDPGCPDAAPAAGPAHSHSSRRTLSALTDDNKVDTTWDTIEDFQSLPGELDEFDARLLQMSEDVAEPLETCDMYMYDGRLEDTAVGPARRWGTNEPCKRIWNSFHSREADDGGHGFRQGALYAVEAVSEPFTGFSRPHPLY